VLAKNVSDASAHITVKRIIRAQQNALATNVRVDLVRGHAHGYTKLFYFSRSGHHTAIVIGHNAYWLAFQFGIKDTLA
jgi:hypothetical protein